MVKTIRYKLIDVADSYSSDAKGDSIETLRNALFKIWFHFVIEKLISKTYGHQS